jgi:hypothetical protein
LTAEEVERIADWPFEDELPLARLVLERGEPLVNAASRSATADSSSTPAAFHERPALVAALLLQGEDLPRRLSCVDQEALAARTLPAASGRTPDVC